MSGLEGTASHAGSGAPSLLGRRNMRPIHPREPVIHDASFPFPGGTSSCAYKDRSQEKMQGSCFFDPHAPSPPCAEVLAVHYSPPAEVSISVAERTPECENMQLRNRLKCVRACKAIHLEIPDMYSRSRRHVSATRSGSRLA